MTANVFANLISCVPARVCERLHIGCRAQHVACWNPNARVRMGCAESKSPETFLVAQSSPEDVIIHDALVKSNYLELHGRRDKSSSLTTMLDGVVAPLSPPIVEVWKKPDGGGVVVQVAQDTWSYPSRDPVVTFFDGAGKPMAVLVFQPKHLKSTGDGRPVLYARNIRGKSDKAMLSDMVAGNKLGAVRASLTTADGAVMPCVGLIHRMTTGMGGDLALYRVDGEQFATTREQAELIYRPDNAYNEVTNAKGEGVAFRRVGTRKVFVAAGVDAVLALALIAADEVNGRLRSGSSGGRDLG